MELTEEFLTSGKLCRTCLSMKTLSDIFEANCDGISVLQMLRECLNHEVEVTDVLPKKICLSCIEILYQTHNFMNLCKRSIKTVDDFLLLQQNKGEHSYAKENHPPQGILEVTAEKLWDTKIGLIQCNEENNDARIEDMDGLVETIKIEVEDISDIKTEIVNLPNIEEKKAVVTERQGNMTSCQVCGKSIESCSLQEHLRNHVITISGQNGFTCIKCKLDFTSDDELRRHCRTKSHLIKTCLICNKTFKDLLRHYNHMQAMHNDIKIESTAIDKPKKEGHSCVVCDTTIKHKSLTRHLKTHLISKSHQNGYTCIKCKVSFISIPALREHCESEIHLNKACLICDKTFHNLHLHFKHTLQHRLMNCTNTPINISRKKPQTKYTCRFCNMNFEAFVDIYSHYEDNHYSSKDCIICNKTYNLAKRVRYHINSHSDKKFSCYPCKVAYVTREELDQHHLTPEHINRKKCSVCFRTFKNKNNMEVHMLSHTKEKKYQCDECGQKFIYSTSIERHKKRHAGASCICDICGKEIATKYNLDIHKQNVHGHNSSVTPFSRVCELCGHVAKSPKLSILHEARHKYNHTRICKKCNATFLDRAELNQHIESSHQIYHCKECPKKFDYPEVLKRHTLIHQWDKLDNVDALNCCRLCTARFDHQEPLTIHYAKEHQIHPCFECNACFLYKYLLDDHSKTKHLGIYKYNCSFCDKNFATKFRMGEHELTHTGKKPQVCKICSAKFRQKVHLIRHMRTHTGEKPYVCRFCGKTFAQLTNCATHERIHTGEKPYTCDVCDKGFYHGSTMKKHRLTHDK